MNQAALTENNVEDLVFGGYGGGDLMAPFPRGARGDAAPAGAGPSGIFARSLRALGKEVRSESPARLARGVQNVQDVVPGECGGRLVLKMSVDEMSGDFSGIMDFQNYCSEEIVLSGPVRVAAKYDWPFYTTTISFDHLTMSAEGASFAMSGGMELREDYLQLLDSLSMTLDYRHAQSGLVYRLENYRLQYYWNEDVETVDGRYFDPRHGYVDLQTWPGLRTVPGYVWPVDGLIVFTGAGSSSRLRFTPGEMVIEGDFEGAGLFGWKKIYPTGESLPPDYNIPPRAHAGEDREVIEGVLVRLDGGGSSDVNGDILYYSWSIISHPPGSTVWISTPFSQKADFVPDRPGRYEVLLTVNDGRGGQGSDTVVVTVRPETFSHPDLLRREWKYDMFGTSIGVGGLVLADIDGDGSMEIVTAARLGQYPDTSFWYVVKHAAPGEYRQIWSSDPYAQTITALIVADTAPDSGNEIFVALHDGTIQVVDGRTLQERGILSTGIPIEAMAVADVDGDGTKEILLSDGTKLLAYSADTLTQKWMLPYYGGTSIAVGNVDDDSSVEIVTTSSYRSGYVIDGSTRTLKWEYPNGFGSRVAIGDIDGSGRNEIVGNPQWENVVIFDAREKAPSWEIATSHDVAALLLADTDGDGVLEILYGDGQWGSIHCYDGRSREALWSISNPEHGVTGIAFGDVDGSGAGKVFWGAGATSSGPDYLYAADPARRVIEWQNVHLDGPLSAVDIGDLDGDGREEIVMVSSESKNGHGDGVIHEFDASTKELKWRNEDLPDIRTWSGVSSVKIGDVNGDGEMDYVLATAHLYNGLVQIYDGKTHQLQRQSISYFGQSFSALALGDVDGDGRMEIVVGTKREHTGATGVHIIVFDGATLEEKWKSEDLGVYWGGVYDLKLADVDGDGRKDILVSLPGGRVYAFDGETHQMIWFAPLEAWALEVADVTGDGKPEILVGLDRGEIQVYRGADFFLLNTARINSACTIGALRVDDVDQDGDAEWLIGSGGRLTILAADGSLKWRSGYLGQKLGWGNHLISRDIDGDGRKDIVLGSQIGLYQFKVSTQ